MRDHMTDREGAALRPRRGLCVVRQILFEQPAVDAMGIAVALDPEMPDPRCIRPRRGMLERLIREVVPGNGRGMSVFENLLGAGGLDGPAGMDRDAGGATIQPLRKFLR